MKASIQDFITKIFTQIKNNFGNVDNTSDADKPISKAQQAEFDAINNNLDKLEYSEVAGGKNLARKNDWKGAANYVCLPDEPAINGAKPISIGDFPKGTYTVSYNCDLESGATQCSFRDADWNLVGTSTLYNKSGANSYTVTTTSDAKYITLYCNNSTIELTNIQIEKGSKATEYRPYIKSAKSLNDDVNAANSGLDTLAYSDTAGGKNLFNGKIYNGYWDSSTGEKVDSTYWLCSDDLIKVQPNTNYIASGVNATTFQVVFLDSNKKAISQTDAKVSFATPSNAKYIGIYFASNGTYSNIQIEDGTIATTYKPYIPSVKMLSEKSKQIDDNNMLGWVVPEEMPIKNYVDSNGVFHQRVGRVDLGSLDWFVDSYGFVTNVKDRLIKDTNTAYIPSFIATKSYEYDYNLKNDKTYSFSKTQTNTWIKDSSYTDATAFKTAMQGVYLYYELAEEITTSVDGNEAVTKVNDSLADYGMNNVCGNISNGYWDNASKQIVSASDFHCSSEIKSSSSDKIIIKANGAARVLVRYYDSSSAYIGQTDITSGDFNNIIINPISNTASLGVSVVGISKFSVYINNSIDELKNDLDTLQKNIPNFQGTITKIGGIETVENNNCLKLEYTKSGVTYEAFIKLDYINAL